jgi:hypothetical protein
LKRASLPSETLPLIRNPPTPVNQSQSASEPTLSWTPPFHAFFPHENLLSRTQQSQSSCTITTFVLFATTSVLDKSSTAGIRLCLRLQPHNQPS